MVSVPIRRSNRFKGVAVHQLTDLSPDHITLVNDIPTTIGSRTMVDLAAVLPYRALRRALDDANRNPHREHIEQTWEMLQSLARSGKPGVRTLRLILQDRLDANLVTDSTMESRLIDLLTSGWITAARNPVDTALAASHVRQSGHRLS